MTKPKFASSHDWHVQLCCQRSRLHPHWAGSFGSRTMASIAGCVLELDGAVCWPCSLHGARTAHCSSFSGRSVSSGVLRELFKIIELERLCQLSNSFLFSAPSTSSRSLRKPSGFWSFLPAVNSTAIKCQTIHTPTTARSLGSFEIPCCSDLGLESGRPSWARNRGSIKRLDCASSYSSTSSSRRFQPARPIMPRCEARSTFCYST